MPDDDPSLFRPTSRVARALSSRIEAIEDALYDAGQMFDAYEGKVKDLRADLTKLARLLDVLLVVLEQRGITSKPELLQRAVDKALRAAADDGTPAARPGCADCGDVNAQRKWRTGDGR
ncbi:MAG: hypothetical protein HY369_01595 [Candidatus Aenigmarchaeota archaeon]|nr:hypothetical protein [Candidatus Aenigmarchaeota archaeon]